MITITNEPPSITRDDFGINDPKQPPVPMSDCLEWCLQADAIDAIAVAGSQAQVQATFPATCTVPADGTVLKIWGHDFTVQSAQDYTSDSFKVVTSGLFTALNFGNMITANYFFNTAATVTAAASGTDWIITIKWTCGVQENFTGAQMDFTALTALGGSGSFTNGTEPEYTDGYKIITRPGFWQDATQNFLPIGRLLGVEPDRLCSTVGEVCLNYVDVFAQGLFTHFPDLTYTSKISTIENGRSLMRLLSIEYGWIYRENCQPKSGTIKKSNIVLGINAAFDVDDEYQIRRYWHNHPDGFPPGQFYPDFLTTQPKTHTLCLDSYAWLWWLNNRQQEHGQYRVSAGFYLKKIGVAGVFESFTVIVNDPNTDGSSWYQPVNFNVSPQFVLANAPTLTEADLESYEVKLDIVPMLSSTPIDNASEYLKFVIQKDCCDYTDVYFLTPPGGWGTQPIEIQERSVSRAGQEVNIYVSCEASRVEQARQGGRTLMNLRAFERIRFQIRLENTDENRRWMKHLAQSPQHKIKVPGERVFSFWPDVAVAPLAKKFLLDADSIIIATIGTEISFTATGYMQDIPVQKGTEPNI